MFDQTLDAAVSQNHLRTPAADARNGGSDGPSLALYKDRFADASDFVFVFVGSFPISRR